MVKGFDRYFTTSEAAEIINKSRDTIYRYIRDGHLEAVRLVERGDYMIPQSSLQDLLIGRQQPVSSRSRKKTRDLLRKFSA